MIGWIKGLPFAAKLITGGIVLALGIALIFAVTNCVKDTEDAENQNYVNQGVTQERAETQGEVLNNVKNAHEAVSNPSADDLNVVCSKYDRNCAEGNK